MKKIVAPLKSIAVRAGIVLIAAGLVGVWLAPAAKWNRLIRPYYEQVADLMDQADKVLQEGSQPDASVNVAATANFLGIELVWNIGPVPACAYLGVLHLRTTLDIIERTFPSGMDTYRETMLKLARGHLEAAREDVFCP